MAVAGVGIIKGNGCARSSSSWFQTNIINRRRKKDMVGKRVRFVCASSSSLMDPYKTLRVHPDASEYEVKNAFRQLALQYHPDVCRGSNCGVQFNLINEAYKTVMSKLRGELVADQMHETYDQGTTDETMRGMSDPDWDMWEEWMGWEGAGIRDYSSHINPYI